MDEWDEKKRVIEEEIFQISSYLNTAAQFSRNEDGCDNTIFKQQKYTFFSAEVSHLQEDLSEARYRLARVEKYISLLAANRGEECSNRDFFLGELLAY